jgi:hypothetical protein
MEILIAIIIAAMVIINYFVQKKRGDL